MKVWAVSLLTTKLSPRGLTPCLNFWHSEFGKNTWKKSTIIFPVLYLQKKSAKASPKAISGRTSYYQARLAFHFLPQLIPEC